MGNIGGGPWFPRPRPRPCPRPRPRPRGLRWGMFGPPGCSGASVRDGSDPGCRIGMFVEGSKKLGVVLWFRGLGGGIAGDVGGPVLKDKS